MLRRHAGSLPSCGLQVSWLAVWVCIACVMPAPPTFAQPPTHVERVDVSRIVIDTHVLHTDGRPVSGLTAKHFRVRVDGIPVPLLSANWTTQAVADRHRGVSGGQPGRSPSLEGAGDTGRLGRPGGRQIVFLVQKDFEQTRLAGLIDLLRRTRTIVEALRPDDRVAILSFDFRLVLWIDFTLDRRALDRVLERGILLDTPPETVPAAGTPSLALYFDPAEGRRAASMEQALFVLARSLWKVPGTKSLVLLGHGFGRLGVSGVEGLPTAVTVDDEYEPARRLLVSGRTTVYCLDTTRAASHSLEAGLQRVAADTGGFFVRTHDFPIAALRRLGDALSGRYELVIEKPALPPGEHRITVGLVGRKGLVLARRTYVG